MDFRCSYKRLKKKRRLFSIIASGVGSLTSCDRQNGRHQAFICVQLHVCVFWDKEDKKSIERGRWPVAKRVLTSAAARWMWIKSYTQHAHTLSQTQRLQPFSSESVICISVLFYLVCHQFHVQTKDPWLNFVWLTFIEIHIDI